MEINYLTPDIDAITEMVKEVRKALYQQGVLNSQAVSAGISNLRKNAAIHAKAGIDAWLGYGGTLPALERVFSTASGETEEEFYRRTQYPKYIVDAYTIPGDDLATLVFCEQYWTAHRRTVPSTNSIWPLNQEEGTYIDLNDYEGRLRGLQP